MLTLAAVILSKPGGVIPMNAEIKPEKRDRIKFIGKLKKGVKIPEISL
jgi:hypothetical protein